MNPRIATYVLLDLETTGFPSEESNRTKITEISMIAVKRSHILETVPGAQPRIQHKVTLCLNPGRLIYPSCSEVTGLSNDILEKEPYFKMDVFIILSTFLNVLEKPVCLIAQNGFNFDYPILKNHLVKLNVSFCKDLLCADSLHAFYKIQANEDELMEQSVSNILKNDNVVNSMETLLNEDTIDMQSKNENTPKKQNHVTYAKTPRKARNNLNHVFNQFPWPKNCKPKHSYKLSHVYERLLNRPPLKAHRAESDCMMLLETITKLGRKFVEFVDSNHLKFTDIYPMEIGIPIGRKFY